MKNFMKKLCLVCGLAPGLVNADLEDTRALYDLAPEDAAYIRLVNGTQSPVALTVGEHRLSAETFCSASAVEWVPPGTELGANHSTQLESGALYTLVILQGGDKVIRQPAKPDPFKATISSHNLSTGHSISLVTTKGSRPVFGEVAPGAMAERSVNPVTIALSILAGELEIPLEAVSLERGQVTDTFFCEDDDQHSVAISAFK